jgi:predicted nucleic acid-binding protein
MTGCKFIDTNILLYANDKSAGIKQTKAANLLRELWENQQGTLSTQVLQEFFYNATRKLSLPLNVPVARSIVEAYSVWLKAPITDATILGAIDLHASLGFSFWDSLILKAALDMGCDTLYSEDMQHGQVIDNRLTIVNPFI